MEQKYKTTIDQILIKRADLQLSVNALKVSNEELKRELDSLKSIGNQSDNKNTTLASNYQEQANE